MAFFCWRGERLFAQELLYREYNKNVDGLLSVKKYGIINLQRGKFYLQGDHIMWSPFFIAFFLLLRGIILSKNFFKGLESNLKPRINGYFSTVV